MIDQKIHLIKTTMAKHNQIIPDIKNLLKTLVKCDDSGLVGLDQYMSRYKRFVDTINSLIKNLTGNKTKKDAALMERALDDINVLVKSAGQLDDRRSDQFGQPGAAVRGLDTVGVVAEGAPNRKGAHSIGFQRQQKATLMASKRRRDASVLTARMRRMSGPAFGGVAEPTASSAELSASSEEPAESSEEPAESSEELTTSTAELTASSAEPTASSAEPAASSEELSASSEELSASSEELTASSAEPTASSEEPSASSAGPNASSAEPRAQHGGPCRTQPIRVAIAMAGHAHRRLKPLD
ncbi:unnamed protein product [Nesidiocoris tenuis]|uniref:Uncharacterized protein n=1 Tax=Nesidiocoris tenuis TaxID=355587 RepID=A0A6H5HJQ8_9HEMI|nr:unnamed protein product [Nesidiocoris tenuis]